MVASLFLTAVSGLAVQPRVVINSEPAVAGPTFSKPLSTPDAVPMDGRMRALELMSSGALFRYTPGVLSETAQAEKAMCDYTGFKYVVGFNSCGSALFIALKCLGVDASSSVLCNAFSFTAVPSAVHHASATPVYVECTDGFVMDHEDLERKITPETKYLMLTHMRGKVADISKVYEVAEKHNLQVVEDCAHALGIQWEGVQLGRSAKVACFSTQSAKVCAAYCPPVPTRLAPPPQQCCPSARATRLVLTRATAPHACITRSFCAPRACPCGADDQLW